MMSSSDLAFSTCHNVVKSLYAMMSCFFIKVTPFQSVQSTGINQTTPATPKTGIRVGNLNLSKPKPTMKKLMLNGSQLLTGDPTLVLDKPWWAHPSMQITATTPTTGQKPNWVYLALPLHVGDVIKEVTVYYQNSSPRSFITQIRITEQFKPDTSATRHDDGTDLLSTAPTSYTSATGGIPVEGSMTLQLRLEFARIGDMIKIGAIEIGYQPV
jgi:hypothetical protein